jgi:hypothetical protein
MKNGPAGAGSQLGSTALAVDTGQLRHRLDRDFDFPDFLALQRLVNRRQVLANSVLDVLERLFLSLPLRPTPRKARAGDTEALIATLNRDLVPHAPILPSAKPLNPRA